MKHLSKSPFTLIELIVSMAIFLVILLVLVTMLGSTVKLSRKRKQQADIYHQQQVLSSIFSRDLENMIAQNQEGEEIYLRLSGSSAAFVSTSTIGSELNDSETCPVNSIFYTLSDGKIYRGVVPVKIPYSDSWSNPDWVNNVAQNWLSVGVDDIDSDVIAEDINQFSISALWPTGSYNTAVNTLPVMVNIAVSQLDEFDTDRNDSVKPAYRGFAKRIFIRGSTK